jgi:hypothetical protein
MLPLLLWRTVRVTMQIRNDFFQNPVCCRFQADTARLAVVNPRKWSLRRSVARNTSGGSRSAATCRVAGRNVRHCAPESDDAQKLSAYRSWTSANKLTRTLISD